MSHDVHSCSFWCDLPACIKAQRDELRDRLAAMRSTSEPSAWRPIETAPRDLTTFLVWHQSWDRPYLAYRDQEDYVWIYEKRHAHEPSHWAVVPQRPAVTHYGPVWRQDVTVDGQSTMARCGLGSNNLLAKDWAIVDCIECLKKRPERSTTPGDGEQR